MGIALESSEIDAGAESLEVLTREAASQMVTGVPTFMLGEFPFGGIQEEDTMRSILGRFADRQRRPT